jgi:uncharacterized protein (DUF1778 family)
MKDDRPQINFRASADDVALMQAAAKATGQNLSAWLRLVALKAARRDLAELKRAA